MFFIAASLISLGADKRYRSGVVCGLGVVLPFGLWQLFLRLWLGEWGVNSGGARASSFELIPYRGWWRYPHSDQKINILLPIFILLVALIPAMAGLIACVSALSKSQRSVGAWILLFNAIIFPLFPTSNVLNLPGLLRITKGLVVAVLNYGAIQSSRRALLYSQLWLILLVFGEGLIAIY